MDSIGLGIIKNWLMSKRGNDYWTYNKYLDCANIKDRPFMSNMENFLDDPFDESGKQITHKELIWKIRGSATFNPRDTFAWYQNGILHSDNTIFPHLCDVDKVANFILDNDNDLDDNELRAILERVKKNMKGTTDKQKKRYTFSFKFGDMDDLCVHFTDWDEHTFTTEYGEDDAWGEAEAYAEMNYDHCIYIELIKVE